MNRTVDTKDVQALVERGAQLVEVLPKENYDEEHLPGAVSIPLPELRADTVDGLDRSLPTVSYCYDHECDLSSRGAALLSALGFTDVYDYAASKVAWLAMGLPSEGTRKPSERAGSHVRKVPTVDVTSRVADLDGVFDEHDVAVVLHDDVVVGVLRAEVTALPDETCVRDAMQTGAPSVRPSITVAELAKSMDKAGERWVLVTALDGTLLGVAWREDLDGV